MIRAGLVLAALLATAVPVTAQQAAPGQGAVLRVLDKTTGIATDLELEAGESAKIAALTVSLGECRYPVENPSGDAFTHLTIHYREAAEPVFDGWMIASAPALNPMEHPRYDVWALRCTTS